MITKTDNPSSVDLQELVHIFYHRSADLGGFQRCEASALPSDYRQLLAHHGHMTVTVEAFHRSLVDVLVHRTDRRGNLYAREITLARQSDGKVVQYGIVRLNATYLDPAVWREIASEQVPLGRVLIEHNVLREVVLEKLWKVECGEPLSRHLDVPVGTITYGRTAMIFCNKEPAIELLEIVIT